jgi:hypothetical protein
LRSTLRHSSDAEEEMACWPAAVHLILCKHRRHEEQVGGDESDGQRMQRGWQPASMQGYARHTPAGTTDVLAFVCGSSSKHPYMQQADLPFHSSCSFAAQLRYLLMSRKDKTSDSRKLKR